MKTRTTNQNGQTLFAIYKRLDTDEYWQETSEEWGAGSVVSNIRIDANEGSGAFAGAYEAENSGSLGSPGYVEVTWHNANLSNRQIGREVFYVTANEPVPQEFADAMLLTPTAQSQSLYNKAGGSNSIPVSQVPVPGGRTVVLQQTSTGLRGEFSKSFNVAEDKLFAVDFRKDMSVNQRFASIVAIELESGTEGGITFDEEEQGVDGSLVKFKAAAVTAGTYVIKITVTYGPNGEAAEGQVTLVVV